MSINICIYTRVYLFVLTHPRKVDIGGRIPMHQSGGSTDFRGNRWQRSRTSRGRQTPEVRHGAGSTAPSFVRADNPNRLVAPLPTSAPRRGPDPLVSPRGIQPADFSSCDPVLQGPVSSNPKWGLSRGGTAGPHQTSRMPSPEGSFLSPGPAKNLGADLRARGL